MNITTPRLHIRPVARDDAQALHEYLRLPEVAQMLGWRAHACPEETARALDSWLETGNRHAIALADGGRVIGHISVNADSEEGRADTRELGFALNPAWQHRGYMTEAVCAVVEELFRGEVSVVWACCFAQNAASRALIERCGFAFVQRGRYNAPNGLVFDTYEYRAVKGEWQAR